MYNFRITTGLLVLTLAGMTAQAAAPSLSYEVNGNELIINYTGTLLQSTDAVNWTEVAFASSPCKVKISDKKLFFCAKGETSKNMTIPLSDTVSLDMIWIEPGTFMMGSPEDELGRWDDETQHQVTLTQEYWLGKYEVTQAQYEAVMGTNPSHFKGADLPVEWVTWDDAMEFCAKLTGIEKAEGRLPEGYEYTLPTEAQWEYACRAGTTTAFNNGTNIPTMLQCTDRPCPNLDPLAWYGYNSGQYDSAGNYTGNGKTFPVGQKQPNAWGLYDMHGNVWEWCLDWYESYPSSAVTDPKGPATGSFRVVRGGSWYGCADSCRSANRFDHHPDNHSYGSGFRVALAPVQ